MVITTREQRIALKRVYDRCKLWGNTYTGMMHNEESLIERGVLRLGVKAAPQWHGPLTYRQFRRAVQPTFCMDDAVILPWCGMWLAIERDGYTHS